MSKRMWEDENVGGGWESHPILQQGFDSLSSRDCDISDLITRVFGQNGSQWPKSAPGAAQNENEIISRLFASSIQEYD